MLSNAHHYVQPADETERLSFEAIIREDFACCHPEMTLDDLRRRAAFSKEDRGLLRDWIAIAAKSLGRSIWSAQRLVEDCAGCVQPIAGQISSERLKYLRPHVAGTDSRGNAAYNKGLSARRAASVVTWLVSHGIDKARLSSAGFGPERPIATNDTEEGRQANRRVELVVMPNVEEMLDLKTLTQ